MSTTVTGSPPRGQPGGRTASHRRGSAAQAASRARRRFRLPRASTTPGKPWLVRSTDPQVPEDRRTAEMAGYIVMEYVGGVPRPAFSTLFSPEVQVQAIGTDAELTPLPMLASPALPPPSASPAPPAPSAPPARVAPPPASEIVDELPGELAPKLALAFAAEAAGDLTTAGRYFRLVWTVDRSYISAAFGMARTCLAAGDRPGAIAALAAVPVASSHYAAAQIAAVRILVSGDHQGAATGDQLRQAGGQLARPAVDDVRWQQLTVEILRAALDWCTSGRPAGGDPILGCEPNPRAVRFGLERSYRALARLTPDQARRIELVDLANAIRPRTLT